MKPVEVIRQILPISQMRGKIGDWVVQGCSPEFANVPVRWTNALQLRRYVIQKESRTPKQIIQRNKMIASASAWRALSDDEKNEWKQRAKGTKNYGYSLFSRSFLK